MLIGPFRLRALSVVWAPIACFTVAVAMRCQLKIQKFIVNFSGIFS
jgi:hypothetical protein